MFCNVDGMIVFENSIEKLSWKLLHKYAVINNGNPK
jgi:hypothetical protein